MMDQMCYAPPRFSKAAVLAYLKGKREQYKQFSEEAHYKWDMNGADEWHAKMISVDVMISDISDMPD